MSDRRYMHAYLFTLVVGGVGLGTAVADRQWIWAGVMLLIDALALTIGGYIVDKHFSDKERTLV